MKVREAGTERAWKGSKDERENKKGEEGGGEQAGEDEGRRRGG